MHDQDELKSTLSKMRAQRSQARDKYNQLLELYETRQERARASGYWLPKGSDAAHLKAYGRYEVIDSEVCVLEYELVRQVAGNKAQFKPGETSSFLKRPPQVV